MLKSSMQEYIAARKNAEQARKLVGKFLRFKRKGCKGALALDARIRALVKPGYYEHFKSSEKKPKFYRVYEVLSHVNYQLYSHHYQVSYSALYPPFNGKKALRELLGEDGFLTPVQKDGYEGPRFIWAGKHLPRRAARRK